MEAINIIMKRILAFMIATAVVIAMVPSRAASADSSQDFFDCVLFSYDSDESIRITAQSISVNGDVVTNGNFWYQADNSGINGTIFENMEQCMVDYHSTIEKLYFYDDVNYIDYDYSPTNYNERIMTPTFVEGNFTSNSNVDLISSALMTMGNIVVDCDTFNSNSGVLYSQLGNICIKSNNFNANGLIYAPFGSVYIEAGNVNMSGIIIAKKIEIIGEYNVSVNKNRNFLERFGSGTITPSGTDSDPDILDIGEVYFKDITSEDDVVSLEDGGYCVRNQMLLTATSEVDFADVELLAAMYDAQIVGYIELTNDYQIEFNMDVDVENIKEIINEVSSYSFVESASLNIIPILDENYHTNDREWSSSWNESYPSGNDWGVEAIKLKSALESLGVITASSSNGTADTSKLYDVKIGLIDGSFDKKHEDLKDNFKIAWNNYLSREDLINAATDDNHEDHGTHVAGTMAAGFNNGVGITGICVKNRLYGFSYNGKTDKVIMGEGKEIDTNIFKNKCALTLLIGNNVKVINFSQGNSKEALFAAQEDAVIPKGFFTEVEAYTSHLDKLLRMGYDFLLVCSAGNDHDELYYKDSYSYYGYVSVSDYDDDSSLYPYADTTKIYGTQLGIDKATGISSTVSTVVLNDSDAKYNSKFLYTDSYLVKSHVVCVGAMSQSLTMSDFSVRGQRVDILAPGEKIYSCVPNNAFTRSDYKIAGGTSMAAPHVSGALGLAYSVFPRIDATRLKTILIRSASDIGQKEVIRDGSVSHREKNYTALDVNNLIIKVNEMLSSFANGSTEGGFSQFNGVGIGFVFDEAGEPIPDVKITATCISEGDALTNNSDPNTQIVITDTMVTTDSNGAYEVVRPSGEYILQFEKSGYLGETIYFTSLPESITYVDTVTLFDKKWNSSIGLTVHGKVTDALNGNGVDGVTIKFRKGWNNERGDYVKSFLVDKQVKTDSNGEYEVGLAVGAYTAELVKDGYVMSHSNIVASPNGKIQYSTITPKLDENEFRIILTWGDSPSDLDSYLAGTLNGNDFLVNYSRKTITYNGSNVVSLDLDDTTSYGPETITLSWSTDFGDCTYYVSDYSNRWNPNSMALSYSFAKVVIYKGNSLLSTYNVPVGINGTRWDVFSIKNGELTPINKVS